MLASIAIDGPIAWGLLAAPCALLVVAAGLALRSKRRHSNQASDKSTRENEHDRQSTAGHHNSVLGLTGQATLKEPESEHADNAVAPPLQNLPATADDGSRVALLDAVAVTKARRKITSLERAGARDDTLALLYLQVGEHLCKKGQRSKGLEFIRKCIEHANSYNYVRLHAQARLVLAELAVDDGDNTGACEQWQMARELFDKSGDKELGRQISTHMNHCGCPTDWVLNDF